MKYLTKLPIVILLAAALTGCEEQEYFKSESQIKKELAYSWKQVLMVAHTDSTIYEIWTFKEDELTIVFTTDFIVENNLPPSRVIKGTYSINTTMTKVFIEVANFPDDAGSYYFNSDWTAVRINNKILVIACEDPRAGGLLQREFTRMD